MPRHTMLLPVHVLWDEHGLLRGWVSAGIWLVCVAVSVTHTIQKQYAVNQPGPTSLSQPIVPADSCWRCH